MIVEKRISAAIGIHSGVVVFCDNIGISDITCDIELIVIDGSSIIHLLIIVIHVVWIVVTNFNGVKYIHEVHYLDKVDPIHSIVHKLWDLCHICRRPASCVKIIPGTIVISIISIGVSNLHQFICAGSILNNISPKY